LQTLFGQLGNWLQAWLAPPACALAPFASHIIALDETKLDAVVRHLPWQRQHRVGDPALLAGKLAALFDIRAQRWLRIQYVADALRNCKLEALALVADLPWHSLLLFDLGYFSFPWFDYLSERGFYWISRYREKTRYQLQHVYYRQGVILDAVVWLAPTMGPVPVARCAWCASAMGSTCACTSLMCSTPSNCPWAISPGCMPAAGILNSPS
jgi:hypothetical protein